MIRLPPTTMASWGLNEKTRMHSFHPGKLREAIPHMYLGVSLPTYSILMLLIVLTSVIFLKPQKEMTRTSCLEKGISAVVFERRAYVCDDGSEKSDSCVEMIKPFGTGLPEKSRTAWVQFSVVFKCK